ncbi:MAG TPA: hypothetical protein VES21_03755 [Nocardioidaceae bacterium]|nr:hypothetical protein [Nocardioidaceae bacterium]
MPQALWVDDRLLSQRIRAGVFTFLSRERVLPEWCCFRFRSEAPALVFFTACDLVVVANRSRDVGFALQVSVDAVAEDSEATPVREGLEITLNHIPPRDLQQPTLLYLEIATDDGASNASSCSPLELDVALDAGADDAIAYLARGHADAPVIVGLDVSAYGGAPYFESGSCLNEHIAVDPSASQRAGGTLGHDHAAVNGYRADETRAGAIVGGCLAGS